MDVLAEVLAPGVQDQGDADLAPDPARVAAEGQERVRRRREQEAVEPPRVAPDQRVEGVRQREHDVVVPGRQELVAARLDPALLGQGLALGAVAVPAGVVAQGEGAAAVAGLDVAAHGLGAAGLDGPHGAGLVGARVVALAVGLAVAPKQRRDLEPCRLRRRAHGRTAGLSRPARPTGRAARSWSSGAAR